MYSNNPEDRGISEDTKRMNQPSSTAKAEYKCKCGFTVTAYNAVIQRIWKKGQETTIQYYDYKYEHVIKGFLWGEECHTIKITYDIILKANQDIYTTTVLCPICNRLKEINYDLKPRYFTLTGPDEGWNLVSKREVSRIREPDRTGQPVEIQDQK